LRNVQTLLRFAYISILRMMLVSPKVILFIVGIDLKSTLFVIQQSLLEMLMLKCRTLVTWYQNPCEWLLIRTVFASLRFAPQTSFILFRCVTLAVTLFLCAASHHFQAFISFFRTTLLLVLATSICCLSDWTLRFCCMESITHPILDSACYPLSF